MLFSSCIQEVPLDFPDTSQQTVVSSLINPNEQICLNISNLSLFSDTTDLEPPNILEISILQDGVLVDHPSELSSTIFTSIFPKEESNYELIIRTDTDTLTAKTSIPAKVWLTKADYWFSDVPSENLGRLAEGSMAWTDPAESDNFYEIQILYWDMRSLSYYQFDKIDDPVVQQECDLSYAPSSFVFSDKQFDGKTYTMHLKFGIGYSATRPSKAYVVFRSVSEEYYHFMKSWHKHVYLQSNFSGDEEGLELMDIYQLLFQGDPIPLFSNIEGGTGIFVGYSEEIREFNFRQ
jgi:hypothetical protein